MYDDLNCRYPLPVVGANDFSYQTKDLDCTMDNYEIREDGTLWHEDYDIEDLSDPNAEGIMRFSGMMSRVNQRWHQVVFTGEVWFYEILQSGRGAGGLDGHGWIEWSAYFRDGSLQQLNLVRHELPKAVEAVARTDEGR